MWKEYSQRSAESRGFSPGTPVSSHMENWPGGIGNTGPTVIGSCCCGDPAPVAKLNKQDNNFTVIFRLYFKVIVNDSLPCCDVVRINVINGGRQVSFVPQCFRN